MGKIQKDKLIVFDMDGTLYKLKGGAFLDSKLNKKILENVLDFIQLKLKKSKEESETILDNIKKEYGENISIALEEKYKIDRYDYFNYVWDIKPKEYIIRYSNLEDVLVRLTKEYKFILMSDAPRVWIENVLKELNVERFFNGNILSGEGGKRKIFGNYFSNLLKEYSLRPEKVIVVGDQENTDIIPAKKLGINTIYINKKTKSEFADINIKNIDYLEPSISLLFSNYKNNKYYKHAYDFLGVEEPYETTILSGSSSSIVFKYNKKLYKSGPLNEMEKEIDIYNKFKKVLRGSYNKIFPNFKIINKTKNIFLCEFDFLGDYNLEDYLLSPREKDKKLANIINKNVLKKLDKVYGLSCKKDEKEFLRVIDEVIEAMKINLKKADLFNDDNNGFLKIISKNKKRFISGSIVSLSHKDFTVGNIIINRRWKNSYFIDPKDGLSYLDKGFAIGNIGLDLIGYYVSVLRKEMEFKKIYGESHFEDIKLEIDKKINYYLKKDIINKNFINLCMCYWYSVYLACKCNYCTSVKRKWLYIKMEKSYFLYKNKIERSLKTGFKN